MDNFIHDYCSWITVCVLLTPLCPTLCHPVGRSPPGSSVHGILLAGILEWIPCPFPGDLPNPGINTVFLICLLHWQVGSLPLSPPAKPLGKWTFPCKAFENVYIVNHIYLHSSSFISTSGQCLSKSFAVCSFPEWHLIFDTLSTSKCWCPVNHNNKYKHLMKFVICKDLFIGSHSYSLLSWI